MVTRYHVSFLRTMLFGYITKPQISLTNDIEANNIAFEACQSASVKLGFGARSNFSQKELGNLRDFARAEASALWQRIDGSRPPLEEVLHGVDKFVFLNEIVESHERDERWFLKHPERRFRVRNPLPHELIGGVHEDGKNDKVSTIVVRGRSDGKGNTDPPQAVVCVTSKSLSSDKLTDSDLEKIVVSRGWSVF
jgi:hypothetical protein